MHNRATSTDRSARQRIGAEEISVRDYNLDIKNPHTEEEAHYNPETLPEELTSTEAKVFSVQVQLKVILTEAPLR
jgi:type I restriction enzyme M protein